MIYLAAGQAMGKERGGKGWPAEEGTRHSKTIKEYRKHMNRMPVKQESELGNDLNITDKYMYTVFMNSLLRSN